jgi:hypothetical protein
LHGQRHRTERIGDLADVCRRQGVLGTAASSLLSPVALLAAAA